MDSSANSSSGTKRRVRGQNVETIMRSPNNDENPGAKRRLRGRNVDNLIKIDVVNCSSSQTKQVNVTLLINDNDKENNTPNLPPVNPSFKRLPQIDFGCHSSLASDSKDNKGPSCTRILNVKNTEQLHRSPLSTIDQNLSNKFSSSSSAVVNKVRVRGKNVDKVENRVFRSTLPSDQKQLETSPSTPNLKSAANHPTSQTSGVRFGSQSTSIHKTPFQHRVPTITLSEISQKDTTTQKTYGTGKSTLTFSMPASSVDGVNKQRPIKKKFHESNQDNQHQSKKNCAKLSPLPVSFDRAKVNSTFEVGESSRNKNLLNEFNNVEDNFSNDSDTTCGSDLEELENEQFQNEQDMWHGYLDLGPPDKTCTKCGAVMWNQERNNKCSTNKTPTFSLCCRNGQVILEKEKQPPEPLATLLSGGVHFRHFKQNIRMYNCMFSMTSTGGKIDHKINKGRAPYCFKVRGVNYHMIGSFLPPDGETPKFCQLYIYDTKDEINNRINAVNGGSDSVDPEIVESLLQMLDQHNRLVHGFRLARERIRENAVDEFRLVLISSSSASGRPNHIGPSNEVAGLIVTDDYAKGFRDTVIESRVDGLQRIYETDPRFMQLQYPILFPHGDIGFHLEMPLNKPEKRPCRNSDTTETGDVDEKGPRVNMTMKEYYNYKLMIRPTEGLTPHLGGRLWQQYVVDAFTAIEQYRLDWIRDHQTTIRSDLYHNIRDAVQKGDSNPSTIGKAIILPASFTGCKRYMNQYFKDSLAICRSLGHPSLFLTMTTNTKWPEIQQMLKYLPGVDVVDAPDVVSRVFKLKVDQLLDLIKKKSCFGKCIGVMHVIEFQKRGLPHAHMLIWLHPDDRPKTTEQIDALVSTEIPDPNIDPIGYNAVNNYMIHGPCGVDCVNSPCMIKGKCIKHFPKRYNSHTFFDECGFPIYKRRNTGISVKKKGVRLDNRYVVPYNRDLLVRFQCHINLEVCNNSRSLKYLFKYCLKGHDTATMCLKKKTNGTSAAVPKNPEKRPIDEVKHYLDGRYVCASEASWRIFGFDIHSRWPSVERLPVHLPGGKHLTFKIGDVLQEVCDKAHLKKNKLEAWFHANKMLPDAKNWTYSNFPSRFSWHARPGIWKERKRGDVIGRLSEVHSSSGELLYLRMLLLRIKGATSFEGLRTVHGHVHQTFKEACDALSLLRNDNQWHEAIAENAHTSLPPQLRAMFVNILVYSPVSDPRSLWEAHWRCMSDDIILMRRHRHDNPNLCLSDDDVQNYALAEIEKLLNDIGKSLRDYTTMSFPGDAYFSNTSNRLILEETSYDRDEMNAMHEKNHRLLNLEQKNVYDSILQNINEKKGGVFFVYGSGGCGKTFLWQTLCCRLRSEGRIVLPVASCGIAAVLLPGGRTAHSRFHIPLKLDQYSSAGIRHGTDIAELIQQTDLIIWDEAPMQHRHAFECVDRSLRDIMSVVDRRRFKKPFGGITIVFGGDFRQILPVIPMATRAEIVCAALNRSKLWDFCEVFLLKQNMRLHAGNTEMQNRIIAEFSKWQLSIGDGKVVNVSPITDNTEEMLIKIPDEYVVHTYEDPIHAIFNVTYPDFVSNMSSHSYLRSRAILTPTNLVVDDINNQILEKIPGTLHTYLSQDSIDDAGDDDDDFRSTFPVEYLNSINIPCIPKHELKIKVGVVVMLMRNLNQIMGLCNGTRMIVTGCRKNSIEYEILCGSHVGTKHLIPRIEMIPSDTKWPFELKRIQFPLQICYAMTINKSQGQSLDTVGLYLPRTAFSHGHIYVAISRVTRPEGLHILIDSDTGTTTNVTSNVVFEEVFYNLPSIDDPDV